MLFACALDLAQAVVLDLTFDPSGPSAQLLEENPGSVSIQYDRDGITCKRDRGCRKCGTMALHDGADGGMMYTDTWVSKSV